MKISTEWLKDYVHIGNDINKLRHDITLAAFEVEDVVEKGIGLEHIKVGKVIHIESHPDADKLQVAIVKLGPVKKVTIVCGANNLEEGQKIAVVLPGTMLPFGEKVEARTIRGVLSHGMICSEKELGISDEHQGIMVLPEHAKIGKPLSDVFLYHDFVFDIDITSNRTDACSHIGMAREIAAIQGTDFQTPPLANNRLFEAKISDVPIEVVVRNKELCPLYEALVATDIHIQQSPQWLKNRLTACGLRPINNIVDAANYVMLELGQPLHAFDYHRIEDAKITIRNARENEMIQTLDNENRKLQKSMLVIADPKGPAAIAGVIGGSESAVSSETKTIIIESAHFERVSIRKTSRNLGLRTQASTLFERGVDSHLASQALVRMIAVLRETCPDLKAGNYIQKGNVSQKAIEINLEFEKVSQFLGATISADKIKSILRLLGFTFNTTKDKYKPKDIRENILRVIVPSHRLDIHMDQDVIEEIARIYGYHNIQPELQKTIDQVPTENKLLELEDIMKNILVTLGFTEIRTKSFVGEKEIDALHLDHENHYEIKNPISPEQKYMRTSLLETALFLIEHNNKYFDQFQLFDLGRAYRIPGPSDRNNTPAHEQRKLLLIAADNQQETYFKVKQALDVLFHTIFIPNRKITYKKIEFGNNHILENNAVYHPSKSAHVLLNKKEIGIVGVLHPHILDSLEVNKHITVCELSIEPLLAGIDRTKIYHPISRFPAVVYDLSILVHVKEPAQDIQSTICEYGRKLMSHIDLVDIYQDEKIGKNKKSLSFRIRYQATDHTLRDEEVKRIHDRVVDALITKHHAEVRK